jgi:hypothetical protein
MPHIFINIFPLVGFRRRLNAFETADSRRKKRKEKKHSAKKKLFDSLKKIGGVLSAEVGLL